MGWRHVYGDVTPEANLAFEGGQPFTVAGVPLARDALALEAGLGADVNPSLSLGASYAGQFGDGVESNGFKIHVIRRF